MDTITPLYAWAVEAARILIIGALVALVLASVACTSEEVEQPQSVTAGAIATMSPSTATQEVTASATATPTAQAVAPPTAPQRRIDYLQGLLRSVNRQRSQYANLVRGVSPSDAHRLILGGAARITPARTVTSDAVPEEAPYYSWITSIEPGDRQALISMFGCYMSGGVTYTLVPYTPVPDLTSQSAVFVGEFPSLAVYFATREAAAASTQAYNEWRQQVIAVGNVWNEVTRAATGVARFNPDGTWNWQAHVNWINDEISLARSRH